MYKICSTGISLQCSRGLRRENGFDREFDGTRQNRPATTGFPKLTDSNRYRGYQLANLELYTWFENVEVVP